jgi:hypothetical protein
VHRGIAEEAAKAIESHGLEKWLYMSPVKSQRPLEV